MSRWIWYIFRNWKSLKDKLLYKKKIVSSVFVRFWLIWRHTQCKIDTVFNQSKNINVTQALFMKNVSWQWNIWTSIIAIRNWVHHETDTFLIYVVIYTKKWVRFDFETQSSFIKFIVCIIFPLDVFNNTCICIMQIIPYNFWMQNISF